jgi:hypothetical protein
MPGACRRKNGGGLGLCFGCAVKTIDKKNPIKGPVRKDRF